MHSTTDILLAVQQDPAIESVDWPVFHSWSIVDGDFTGTVFVLDENGVPAAEAKWSEPTDAAADAALEILGRQRIEPWHLDPRGRRVAGVVPVT